ncbi:MAG: FAD-dependent oxidoreductase [Alphaproteobacteria bacterium]|jgi:NADPH-dependent glutamate synthase beta subunit-like oxidoreductase/NAD(P)H-flavin reductase|nr:FAD-dependent oxidoreductase [Alphaproteobacteria bacterium]
MPTLHLGFGLEFQDLYDPKGVLRVDEIFGTWLQDQDTALYEMLMQGRRDPLSLPPKAYSDFLTKTAPHVARFVNVLFNVQGACNNDHTKHAILGEFRRVFLQKYVAPRLNAKEVTPHLDKELDRFEDADLAARCLEALKSQEGQTLARLAAHCAARLITAEERRDRLFMLARPQDFSRLLKTDQKDNTLYVEDERLHPRDGFSYTHKGFGATDAFLEASYCLHCHAREKDSCSKGMHGPQGEVLKNPLGVSLSGCPLGQKISEMAWLRARGETLAAFVVACLDNPLLAATGDRICQDCVQACLFQKQTPVQIPALESAILDDVLDGDWGFEIYSLLTRWSPLSRFSWVPKAASGRSVLIAGMGPAGFTLAHHLLRMGHHVVGAEGLKVSPLSPSLTGKGTDGVHLPFAPLYRVKEALYEDMDTRAPQGFGGVCEYGITARWDKNRLTLIRLLLERQERFMLLSSFRVGSQLSVEDALQMGFDHVALCAGAGAPHRPDVQGVGLGGVRTAADFLMTLQMGGAFSKKSLSALQVMLPLYVVGGGLTALDAATEALAYYPRQVEKIAAWYKDLCQEKGQEAVHASFSAKDLARLETFLGHAAEIENARRKAALNGHAPSLAPLIRKWGGVHVLYRKDHQASPSYRVSAPEMQAALDEGIIFHENVSVLAFQGDAENQVAGVLVQDHLGQRTLAAKTVLYALGTARAAIEGVEADSPQVTRYGDMDPQFAGSVVKAMASATLGAARLDQILARVPPRYLGAMLFEKIKQTAQAKVIAHTALAPGIVSLRVHAPAAARAFEPGQFYRLQTGEGMAAPSEAVALTGAKVDKEAGVLELIILESGASSRLCARLKVGAPVSLMGPSGAPTWIPSHAKVLLVGGGLGNAVLFSIGKALRRQGCEVVYCAGYRTRDALFYQEEIEESASRVIWMVDTGPLIEARRPQDSTHRGSVIDALHRLQEDKIFVPEFLLTIGSAAMMAAVQHATRSSFFKHARQIASVNAPMNCMMKGICAQCVQVGRDPATGKEYTFLACVDQDHPLQQVDFDLLNARLEQNHMQETLTNLWLQGCTAAPCQEL